MEIFVPFDKDDGVIAAIHRQGSVKSVQYTNTGTRLSCRIPKSLIARVQSFLVDDNDVQIES